jgi:hypothetical protein
MGPQRTPHNGSSVEAMSHGRRISMALLASAASLLALQQADLLLRQIQQEGVPAYRISALGGGLLPKGVTEAADAAIQLWTAPAVRLVATRFVVSSTLLDFLFIAAYVWLLAELMRWFADVLGTGREGETGLDAWYAQPVWRTTAGGTWVGRARPLLWLALFDGLENLARLGAFGAGALDLPASTSWSGPDGWSRR